MAGYLLVEKKMLRPNKTDGITPHDRELGFLDYLSELKKETFPFPRGSKLRVVGLEEILLGAGDRADVSAEIYRILCQRANELNDMGGFVQIVFDWPLSFGDELWFTRGASDRVSLRRIFGRVRRQQEGTNVYYLAGFNLT
jgi:hypothetical protein